MTNPTTPYAQALAELRELAQDAYGHTDEDDCSAKGLLVYTCNAALAPDGCVTQLERRLEKACEDWARGGELNERLNAENDALRAEVERLRALAMRAAGVIDSHARIINRVREAAGGVHDAVDGQWVVDQLENLT